MEQYTASNGIEIEISTGIDGTYLIGRRTQFGCSDQTHATGSVDGINALREFFRAEEDERLGRWRWLNSPYVVYAEDANTVTVVHEGEPDMHRVRRGEGYLSAELEQFFRAGVAYFDAHPEPKPHWADAEIISWRDGAYLAQIAQRDPERGAVRDMGWWANTGDGGRWLKEDKLAALIGDAEVTILVPKVSS